MPGPSRIAKFRGNFFVEESDALGVDNHNQQDERQSPRPVHPPALGSDWVHRSPPFTNDAWLSVRFSSPRANEKERQNCMNDNGWPEQSPHNISDADVCEIEGCKRAIGQHPEERALRSIAWPTGDSQSDKTDPRDTAQNNPGTGDGGAKQNVNHYWGIDEKKQSCCRFAERRQD